MTVRVAMTDHQADNPAVWRGGRESGRDRRKGWIGKGGKGTDKDDLLEARGEAAEDLGAGPDPLIGRRWVCGGGGPVSEVGGGGG